MDADQNLALKTRFDYRQYADDYIRPYIGDRRVRDITPEVILAWQRKLLKEGGAKRKKGKDGKPGPGKPLSPNTVNRIRAPLSATFKLAVQAGMIPINPLLQAPRPKPRRKIPKHWSPEEARKFLALMEGDRTWPIWAFLLGSGVRIGELVSLRWPSVDLKNRRVRIVDFVSTLGYDMMPSSGKSRDAIRTIDLDDGLADVLRKQKVIQKTERLAATEWIESDYVFTRPDGGQYHPMNLSRLLATYTTELGVTAAHGPWPSPHQRHVDARWRRAAEGRVRASWPCRSNPLHQSVQPRHAYNATRSRREDWESPFRRRYIAPNRSLRHTTKRAVEA